MNLRKNTIDYFELYVDDDLLLMAEDFYAKSDQRTLEKAEGNIWKKQFDNADTEMQLHKNRIQDFSCTCDAYDLKGQCKHIVFLLFELRKMITAEQSKSDKQSKFSSRDFTVQKILEQVPTPRLLTFLKGYASMDKRFNLMIKTHFAREILGDGSIEAYKSIAGSLLRPVKLKDDKFPSAAVRLLISVCKEFFDQFGDAFSLKQYNQAFYILFSIFPKIVYAKAKIENSNKYIDQLYIQAHELLSKLLKADIAPELKRDVVFESFDLFKKSYYHILNINSNVAITLWRSELSAPHINTLRDLLVFKQSKSEIGEKDHLYATSFLILLDDSSKTKDHLAAYEDVRQLLQISECLRTWEDLDRSIAVLDIARVRSTSLTYQYAINQKLYQRYQENGQVQHQIRVGLDIALYKNDLGLLGTLIDIPDSHEIIQDFIKNIPIRTRKRHFEMKYLAAVEQYTELLRKLEAEAKYEEIKPYDHLIYKVAPDETVALYERHLKVELDGQLGDNAIELVEELIYHLQRKRQMELAQRIKDFLLLEYEHRTTFAEELARI